MKLFSALIAALVVVGLAGCASDSDKDFPREVTRIAPTEAPTFLNADVAGLFGKANFTARVEVQKGFPGSHPPMMGELSGRDGNLFFMSDSQRTKRGYAGGLSVLWDGATQTAYLLNDPLQAYAPIRASVTNGPVEVTVAGEEDIGTEHCRKTIISRRVGTELVPVLVAWRGLAEQELPLKIQSTNTPAAVTLTLSRIRFQAPPPDLFTLPNGFKRYDSTDAMLAELMRRKTDALSARSKMKRERYGNQPVGDEDEMRTTEKPVRPY
jgi:hypothetical protein